MGPSPSSSSGSGGGSRRTDNGGTYPSARSGSGSSEPLRREIAAGFQKNADKEPLPYAVALARVGLNLLQQQKYADAETVLREAFAIFQHKQPEAWNTFYAQSLLGVALLGQKKYEEAELLLLQGYGGMDKRADKIPAPSKIFLTEALNRLVQLYDVWGKKDRAEYWRKYKAATTTKK